MYRIKKEQRQAANRLGVVIRPSTTDGKKIDVFKHGFKVASIGDTRYNDYWDYVRQEKNGQVPKGYANQRRALYKIRHAQFRSSPGTAAYYADKILW